LLRRNVITGALALALLTSAVACGGSSASGSGGTGGEMASSSSTSTTGTGGAACQDQTVDISSKKPTTAHWDYSEEDMWSTLDTAYAACGTKAATEHQTPIDIPAATATADSQAIEVKNYGKVPLKVFTNGHTVQQNYASSFGATDPQITYGGKTYFLVQFHFHTPSEHKVDGVSHPMELHLVHKLSADASAPLAVVGVFLDPGAEHTALKDMLANVPMAEYQELDSCTVQVDLNALLPAKKSFFAYSGSLTTPPCSEGVQWLVMKDSMSMTDPQQMAFQSLIGADARSPQPLNGRAVVVHTEP
jgi:carbonic anhydrase